MPCAPVRVGRLWSSHVRCVVAATCALLLVAACSPDREVRVIDAQGFDADLDPTRPVGSMELVAMRSWGLGRAELARSTPTGSVVVASTVGVDLIAPDGRSTTLATLAASQAVTAISITSDGSRLAIATAPTATSPPRIDVYRTDDGAVLTSWELTAGDGVRTMAFTTAGRLLVEGTTGLTELIPEPGVTPEPLTSGLRLGGAVFLDDGTVFAPVTNSNELIVRPPGGDARARPIDALDGQWFVDAKVAPNGELLGVSLQSVDEFDQLEGVAVLDAQSLDVSTVVQAPEGADSDGSWAVGVDYVALADGPSVVVTDIATGAARSLTSDVESPIGRLLTTATGIAAVHTDGAVTIWDEATWAPRALRPGGTALRDVSVDVSGQSLTAVDYYGRVLRIAIADGTALYDDARYTGAELTAVGIDPSGATLAVASSSGRIDVVNSDLSAHWTLEPTTGRIDSVSFTPSSGLLATGVAERLGETAFDDSVIVWDPATRSEKYRLGGDGEDVPGCLFFYSRVRFSHDEALMAATSHDFTVVLSDASTGEVVRVLEPHASTVLDVAFTPDDRWLVTTSDDSTVRVWAVDDWSLATSYASDAMGGYTAIAPMPDSTTMIVTDVTGAVRRVDIMTGRPVTRFENANYRSNAIALSPDGRLLAAPADDGASVAIWSTQSGARLATLTGHTRPVTGVAFSPDGSWLATSSVDATARTWAISMT